MINEQSDFYKMNQKNALKRINKNVEILFSLSDMDEDSLNYLEDLSERMRADFINNFMPKYREEVAKGLGYE